MANVDLPTHVTLSANTVASVDINGVWPKLHYVSDVGGTVAYVRNDGTNPVTTPADLNWPVFASPADWECIPSTSTDGLVTTVKLKSTSTPVVHIKICDCDD